MRTEERKVHGELEEMKKSMEFLRKSFEESNRLVSTAVNENKALIKQTEELHQRVNLLVNNLENAKQTWSKPNNIRETGIWKSRPCCKAPMKASQVS